MSVPQCPIQFQLFERSPNQKSSGKFQTLHPLLWSKLNRPSLFIVHPIILKCNGLLGSSSHFLAAKRARRVYLTSSVCWVRLGTVSSNQCFFGSVFCAAIAHDVNMADSHEVPPTSLWFWRDWMMSMLFRRACKSNCGAAWPWKFGLRGPVHVMSRDFSQFVRKRFEQFQNTQVDADWSKWLSLAPSQWTYLYVGTPKQEDLQNKTGLLTWNTDHSSSNYSLNLFG